LTRINDPYISDQIDAAVV